MHALSGPSPYPPCPPEYARSSKKSPVMRLKKNNYAEVRSTSSVHTECRVLRIYAVKTNNQIRMEHTLQT